jgi:hypothetical protein
VIQNDLTAQVVDTIAGVVTGMMRRAAYTLYEAKDNANDGHQQREGAASSGGTLHGQHLLVLYRLVLLWRQSSRAPI